MTIRHTLAAALLASAIAAPAAGAMPAPPDMQASIAREAAKAQQRQDLRGEAARDAALHPRKSPVVNEPGATAVGSQTKVARIAPGQPTWPVNPQPLHAPAQLASTTASDDGTDWVLIGLGAGLTLLVIGGIAALASRSRTLPRPRASV
jgi:hypothetical protein